MNIPNAYEDERFDPSVDEGIGFKHKSILCMAIKNSSGQIIGVIQVIWQLSIVRLSFSIMKISIEFFACLLAYQQIQWPAIY